MNKIVSMLYTNWRGVTKTYRIIPHPGTLRYGHTEYHTEDQWLFDATDANDSKAVVKTYALSGVHTWNRSADQSRAWRK